MKRYVFSLVIWAATTPAIFGRIGDTSAAFKNRYGDPVFESFDREGHGMRVYRSPEFKEIRVTFVADKSVVEKYAVADGTADKETLFDLVRKENGDDEFSAISVEGQLEIGMGESEGELKFVGGDGATHSYSGRIEIKKKDQQDYAVVRSGDTVVEMPLLPFEAEAVSFPSGVECEITVLDRSPEDLWAPTAWVGKREHLDDQDMRDDAHTSRATVIKVESGGKRIYDRSFCSVHQREMELRNVSVAFGMLAFSAAEHYCQDHFPHYRDFGIGGCLRGDEDKMIPLYICPDCVKACNEYKAAHPADL